METTRLAYAYIRILQYAYAYISLYDEFTAAYDAESNL